MIATPQSGVPFPMLKRPLPNNPARITRYARLALLELRMSGIEDEKIPTLFSAPDYRADARFEADQRADLGCVVAPAALVKAEMKRLVLH
jgi:hypothetical protein